MRRRYHLSKSSLQARPGDDVYIASRGYVSTTQRPGRDHVGVVVTRLQGDLVEVETTPAWEEGRRDPDTGEMRSSVTVGQPVYAINSGTVTATPPPSSPRVGTFIRMQPDGTALVSLGDSDATVTMSMAPTTTAEQATTALRQVGVDTRTPPDRNAVSVRLNGVDYTPMLDSISYNDTVDFPEARGTSMPLGRVEGTYSASGSVSFPSGPAPFTRALERARGAMGRLGDVAATALGIGGSFARQVVEATQRREVEAIRAAIVEPARQPGRFFDGGRVDVVDFLRVNAQPLTPESLDRIVAALRSTGATNRDFVAMARQVILDHFADAGLTEVVVTTPEPGLVRVEVAEQRFVGPVEAYLREHAPVTMRLEVLVTATHYRVDAVEVADDPAAASFLPRLLPWLGQDVVLHQLGDGVGDPDLDTLADDIEAAGFYPVYVRSRRALRVARERELDETGEFMRF